MRRLIITAAFGAVALMSGAFGSSAVAADHVIKMLNKNEAGQTMVFEPDFVKVEPGDKVIFEPTDKNHNSESVKEIWPEGVPLVKGKFSTVVEFTTDKDGIYVFKCLPHYGMGMVAVVQVGKPTNLDAVKEFKAMGMSSRRMLDIIPKIQ